MIKSNQQQSLPIDPLRAAANVFNLQTLEHSFRLLRHHYPALALLVQNLTAPHHAQNQARCQDCWISVDLDVNIVSDLVTALAAIAEHAAQNPFENHRNRFAIHQTLLDWLMYAQSFLNEAQACPTAAKQPNG